MTTRMMSMTSMADESLALDAPRRGLAPWIAETAFVALLLLIFVSLQPFANRDTVNTAVGAGAAESAGSTLGQVCYLLTFGVLAMSAVMKNGIRAANAVPILFAVLLAWCATTAVWATEPSV